MKKLKLGKSRHTGLKIYCSKCNKDNTDCNHYDFHQYRVRLHVPGTKNKVKVKTLDTRDYDEAVKLSIDFKKEMEITNFQPINQVIIGNDFSIRDGIVLFNDYLEGNHRHAHMKKYVSKGHREETIRYCLLFAESLKKKKIEISRIRPQQVTQTDVSDFYKSLETRYHPKTFNNCIHALKALFNYFIDNEGIEMKNPFLVCVLKKVPKHNPTALTRDEFERILNAVDTANKYKVSPNAKRMKISMYKPYLKEAFKLFLLTGGRREEVINLRWSDIVMTMNGTLVFQVHNLKVERISKKDEIYKYIPIGKDLLDLLNELGYAEKSKSNDYILCPNRTQNSIHMMNSLSRGFTHYKEAAGIDKDISLHNLRKTYITWLNYFMHKETALLTSHSGQKVLDNHYIDKQVINAIDKGALEIKVFGTEYIPHEASSLQKTV